MNVEVHHPSTTKINSDKDNIPTSTSPAAMKVDGNAFDTLPEHPPNLDSIQHDVTTENSVDGSQVNGNYNIQTSFVNVIAENTDYTNLSVADLVELANRKLDSTTSRVEKQQIQTGILDELYRRRQLRRQLPSSAENDDEIHESYVLTQHFMWIFAHQDEDWDNFIHEIEELDEQLNNVQTQEEKEEVRERLIHTLDEQRLRKGVDFDENMDMTQPVRHQQTSIDIAVTDEDNAISDHMQAETETVVNRSPGLPDLFTDMDDDGGDFLAQFQPATPVQRRTKDPIVLKTPVTAKTQSFVVLQKPRLLRSEIKAAVSLVTAPRSTPSPKRKRPRTQQRRIKTTKMEPSSAQTQGNLVDSTVQAFRQGMEDAMQDNGSGYTDGGGSNDGDGYNDVGGFNDGDGYGDWEGFNDEGHGPGRDVDTFDSDLSEIQQEYEKMIPDYISALAHNFTSAQCLSPTCYVLQDWDVRNMELKVPKTFFDIS